MPTVPPSGFGELLKEFRENADLTQEQAAAHLGVSRPTFAQWEGGRHLPAEDKVRRLDELLDAGGALVAASERARATPKLRPVGAADEFAGPVVRPLFQVFRDIRAALMDQLVHDDHGRPLGWRHNLVPSKAPSAALSTAYVLKALTMLGGPDPRTTALVGRLFDRAVRDDDGRVVGWKASTSYVPNLVMTAEVFEALGAIGAEFDIDEALRTMRSLLGDIDRTRTVVLTTALNAVLRLAPESDMVGELVEALLALRRDFDGARLWPEKIVERWQPKLEPSVAHTARAINALRDAPGDAAQAAVLEAQDWLADREDLNGTSESIARDLPDGGREELTMHSFTSAHVVRALAGFPVPSRVRLDRALRFVWDRYVPELHLWAWGNGDVAAWMLMDAVTALHDAALAMATAKFDE